MTALKFNPPRRPFPRTSSRRIFKTRIEKHTRIALAGRIAQRRFSAKSCRPHDSADDLQAAADLLSHLCQSEKELNARLALHQIEVEQALATHWHLVEAVAHALLERKTMIAWEVETSWSYPVASPSRLS